MSETSDYEIRVQQPDAVRSQVVDDLRAKAARDWPGIGLLLEDIIAVVERGPDGQRLES